MKGKTYSFGTGREGFKTAVVNRENAGIEPSCPGPGTYIPQKPLGDEAVAFKLKYKIDFYDAERIARKRNYPAPGTYEDLTRMDAKGSYFSSELQNSKSVKWSMDKRMQEPMGKYEISPGPGYHEQTGDTA